MRQQFTYPDEWNEIQLGMTRQEVYNLIGQGGGEWSGWSGMHWTESHTILKQDMDIYFEGNRAHSLTIATLFARETAGEETPITTSRNEHVK